MYNVISALDILEFLRLGLAVSQAGLEFTILLP
jgi:hypothetical protein